MDASHSPSHLSPCQALFLETLHDVSWRMRTPKRIPMPLAVALANHFFTCHPHKALLWLRTQSCLSFAGFDSDWCVLTEPVNNEDVMLIEQTASPLEEDVLARLVAHWDMTGAVLNLHRIETDELDTETEEDDQEKPHLKDGKTQEERVIITRNMKIYLANHALLERLKGDGLCKKTSTWLGEKIWSESATKKKRAYLELHRFLGNQGILGWRVQPDGHQLIHNVAPTMTRLNGLGFLAYVNLTGLQRTRS